MSEIVQETGQFPCMDGLRSCEMEWNDALRLRVWRFVNLGVKMNAMAEHLGMTESTCNRWLHQDPNIRDATVTVAQRFEQFVEKVRQETALDPMKLSDEDLERLKAETASFKTVRRLKAKERQPVKLRAGKKVAKR